MTVFEAPAFRLTDIRTGVADTVRNVETILRDRHDEQDHARAVLRLQQVRPDASLHAVEAFITALLWYAHEVQRSWCSPGPVFDRRVSAYEECVLEFVTGKPVGA